MDLHLRFLIEIADYILIVCNKMSFPEQKLLKHIKSLMAKFNRQNKIEVQKEVTIIHNYVTLSTVEAVQNYIKTDIENGNLKLNVKERFLSKESEQSFGKVYVDAENNNFYHCVLANKYSEAGKAYNDNTLEFIKSKIKYMSISKQFDIEKSFLKFLNTEDIKKSYFIDYKNIEYIEKEISKELKFIYPIEKISDQIKGILDKSNENIKIEKKTKVIESDEKFQKKTSINFLNGKENKLLFKKFDFTKPVLNSLGFISNFENFENYFEINK